MTRKEREVLHKKVADYIQRHPELTYRQIHELTNISIATLTVIAKKHGCSRRGSRGYTATPELMNILES